MRLRIKQARPVSLNDAVELEAFNRAERAKSDGHVSAVATDGDNQRRKLMISKRWLTCSING
ncbi:hypothetical protein DPMN_169289 [Dreissena polymorpha]|uniref:Uncharacterized protein n=1 Tax=Dreissena polymorpha TaxID=45954 RepID=A0A9D4F3F4_DREPO|nr:hypothetical protein DPMN_168066 [Dreissena polymorpha]KAH3791078.1 hypothetical protein DPMN_169289 [Dreissena polymorpha]